MCQHRGYKVGPFCVCVSLSDILLGGSALSAPFNTYGVMSGHHVT